MTRPWGDDSWPGRESVSVSENDGIVIYFTPARAKTKVQLYMNGAATTRVYASGEWTWLSMYEQEIDDLITALQYAKLKISQHEQDNGD